MYRFTSKKYQLDEPAYEEGGKTSVNVDKKGVANVTDYKPKTLTTKQANITKKQERKARRKIWADNYKEKYGSVSDNIGDAAGSLISAGVGEFANHKQVAGSSAESTAQTFQSAANMAGAGFALGGPIGAAAGAIAGVASGLIDGARDKRIRMDRADIAQQSEYDQAKRERATDYALAQGEQIGKSQQTLAEKQNKFINPYS